MASEASHIFKEFAPIFGAKIQHNWWFLDTVYWRRSFKKAMKSRHFRDAYHFRRAIFIGNFILRNCSLLQKGDNSCLNPFINKPIFLEEWVGWPSRSLSTTGKTDTSVVARGESWSIKVAFIRVVKCNFKKRKCSSQKPVFQLKCFMLD